MMGVNIRHMLLFITVASTAMVARSEVAQAADAHRMVARGALLLDVRSEGEYAHGHLPGAVNIPIDELAYRLGELGPQNRPVVVYCQGGERSANAAKLMRSSGFRRVFDLGAMKRWYEGSGGASSKADMGASRRGSTLRRAPSV
jgi:rhodanese-related sulfurtransferase